MRVRVLELSDDSTKKKCLKTSHNTEIEKMEGLVQEQHRFCMQVVHGQYVKQMIDLYFLFHLVMLRIAEAEFQVHVSFIIFASFFARFHFASCSKNHPP